VDQEQKPRAHECDARGVLGSWVYGVHAQGTTRASYRLARSWRGEMEDPYRYVIHAYEDARQKRPIKHEHRGTTVLADGAEVLERAELLAKEFPDEWVYIHLEYRRERE
jgi:hypothetical protein